ncbi:MAG: polyisoprenoid-binding protein YceI [Bacteriovoracaceae bacterium]
MRFEVGYLSFSKIDGQFKKFWGRVYFEEDLELPRKIELSIDSTSIDTGSRIRDGHLRSDDFFSSKKFPTIRFQSEKFLAGKPNEFIIKGILQLRDKRIPHEVLIKISPSIKDSWDYTNRFVSFKTSLSRKILGLDWNRGIKGNSLLVGDEVLLSGNFQIQPLNKLTPPSKHMIPDLDDLNKAKLMVVESPKERIKTESMTENNREDKDPLMTQVKPTRSKKNYSYILALIILIQLSYLGVLFTHDFLNQKAALKPYKTPIKIGISLLALWAALYAASFTV